MARSLVSGVLLKNSVAAAKIRNLNDKLSQEIASALNCYPADSSPKPSFYSSKHDLSSCLPHRENGHASGAIRSFEREMLLAQS